MGAPLQAEQKSETTSHNWFVRTGILVILVLVAFYLHRPGQKEVITNQRSLQWDDVAYIDEHGEPQLKEWRILDIERQIEELKQAEQYVLLTVDDGFYLCYHCNSRACYLQQDMVWKYGVTRKGVSGRYTTKWLISMNLIYKVQYRGTLQECLIKEKEKIGSYPLHHDNMVRNIAERMARPPGNKNDN